MRTEWFELQRAIGIKTGLLRRAATFESLRSAPEYDDDATA